MGMTRPTLSLIIPIFNEEAVIGELDRRLVELRAMLGVSWEVLFVDDGSQDRSLELLLEASGREPAYRVLSLSRNFGHQAAITAGMDHAEGDAVVVMDADLQDPPAVILDMVGKWREGYDIVYAVRKRRIGESIFKKATAALFYRLLRRMIGVDIPLDAGDFRLMSRPVVLTLRGLRETHRFVRAMVAWVGFRRAAVHYERASRFAGETKYPLRKMLRLAIDAITSFSIVPLRLATWLGVAAGAFAVAVAAWALRGWLYGRVVPGWTTLMVFAALGFSAQFFMIGVLGEYVGRIYEEVKRRPIYIVRDTANLGQGGVQVAGEQMPSTDSRQRAG
jgi:glycosyltransferase involved in cell wall biosynthesis